MKKILLVVAILAVLLITGCNNNQKIEDNNLSDIKNTEQPQIVNSNLNKSFEERAKVYFEQLTENSGDRTKKAYTNIRLKKANESSYELVADIQGELRFSEEEVNNWIKEIEDKKLDKLEVHLLNEDKVIIVYSTKPEFAKKDAAYYDEDWNKANADEWLDLNGVPMFMNLRNESEVEFENDNGFSYDDPILLRKEEDGYYYARYRSIAGVTMDLHEVATINEKDAISIPLNPNDIISIDYYDFYGREEKQPIEMTVEEYYNSSPTKVNEEFIVDINDMSIFSFEIIDNVIHVIGSYDGV